MNEQEPIAWISRFKYDQKAKDEIVLRRDKELMSEIIASGYYWTPLYAEPIKNNYEPVLWIDPLSLPLLHESDKIYVTTSNFDGNTMPLYAE